MNQSQSQNKNNNYHDNKSFEILGASIKAFDVEGEGYYIEGIANTGNKDLYNDKLTVEALESISEQVETHNLHLNHDCTFEGILGPLVESYVDDEGLHYKARILDEKKDFIKSLLDQGVNLGSSINGIAERPDNDYVNVIDWTLTEISLTPIPADQATMSTVQSTSKSFDNIIIELLEAKNMADEETITKDEIIELINTAFNEKQDELVELIRSQLVEEYEATINELTSRIETLEGKIEDNAGGKDDDAKGDNGKDDDQKDDGKDDDTGTDSNTDTDTGKDDEDNQKMIEDMVEKRVEEQMKSLLQPIFKDTKNFVGTDEEKNKKGYTPRELAEMLSH